MNTTDNINPTDKLYEAARNYLKPQNTFEEDDAAYDALQQAVSAYEKSKEEKPHEKVLQAFRELDKSIFSVEQSKQEPTCKTCLNYDGSGWCIKTKLSVGEKQVCPDWFQEQQPTQEPESKDGKTIDEILTDYANDHTYSDWCELMDNSFEHNQIEATHNVMQIYASQEVSKATKDLTNEVERLMARIRGLRNVMIDLLGQCGEPGFKCESINIDTAIKKAKQILNTKQDENIY